MTPKEIRILSWVTLLFGWAFTLANAPEIGLCFLLAAFGLFVWQIAGIILNRMGGGGGPLTPA